METGVTPIMHYDPLGRLIRTNLPDGTFTKVLFNAWEQYNYDANDTVLDSDWYNEIYNGNPEGFENPQTLTGEDRAAYLASKHYETPQIIKYDILGRPFLTTDDNAELGKYSVRTKLDIMGNPITVTDAKGREMTKNIFDLTGRLVKSTNIDSGTRWIFMDAADKPLITKDSRQHTTKFYYDELQRPVHTILSPFEGGQGDVDYHVEKTVYGTDTATNTNGKPIEQYDQSGKNTILEYDFKGNPLSSQKQICTDYENIIDWAIAQQFTDDVFETQIKYDALNRVTEKSEPNGDIVKNEYNKTGLLTQISHNEQVYVSKIEYNARLQRTEIDYGNGSKTKYEYDPENFRLTRLLSTRNNGADVLQDLNYVYDPQGNIVYKKDDAQQTIFFNNSVVYPENKYEYDALYRLLKATGREHVSNVAHSYNDFNNNVPLPSDGNAMQNYILRYQYDELGNILEQNNVGRWTRTYNYDFDTNNYLHSTTVDGSTGTYTYDEHGNMLTMPHLQELKWDYKDNFKEATLNLDGNKAFYTYDAGGNRVRKVVVKNNGSLVEDRIYLGDYEIYRKFVSQTLDVERETVHINDDKQRIAQIDNNDATTTIRYQLSDHLGSASLELDENADIISYEEYYPYGTSSYRSGRSQTEVSQKRYKYVMKELDNETGLYYYGMRYMAPWLAGRFISVDPLQHKYPYYTPFQYAGNKPVTFIDLDGAEPTETAISNSSLPSYMQQPITNSSVLQTMSNISSLNQYTNNLHQNNITNNYSFTPPPPSDQGTISQGKSNYEYWYDATVTPNFKMHYATNPTWSASSLFLSSYTTLSSLPHLFYAGASKGVIEEFLGQTAGNAALYGVGYGNYAAYDFNDLFWSGIEGGTNFATFSLISPYVNKGADYLRADIDFEYNISSNKFSFESYTFGGIIDANYQKRQSEFLFDLAVGQADYLLPKSTIFEAASRTSGSIIFESMFKKGGVPIIKYFTEEVVLPSPTGTNNSTKFNPISEDEFKSLISPQQSIQDKLRPGFN